MTRLPGSYPLALLIALFALVPVGVLVSLASDTAQLFDTHNVKVLGNTLALMGLTVLGSVLIGVPLALLTAYVYLPWRRLWLILFAAPLAMPSYIGAFTLYAAFGPGGEINTLTGIPTPAFYGLHLPLCAAHHARLVTEPGCQPRKRRPHPGYVAGDEPVEGGVAAGV